MKRKAVHRRVRRPRRRVRWYDEVMRIARQLLLEEFCDRVTHVLLFRYGRYCGIYALVFGGKSVTRLVSGRKNRWSDDYLKKQSRILTRLMRRLGWKDILGFPKRDALYLQENGYTNGEHPVERAFYIYRNSIYGYRISMRRDAGRWVCAVSCPPAWRKETGTDVRRLHETAVAEVKRYLLNGSPEVHCWVSGDVRERARAAGWRPLDYLTEDYFR